MEIKLDYSRRKTSQVQVGNICIGSDNPIRIQTMANTNTNDIDASVDQARRCIEAGAELLRFTTQGLREVESLKEIHSQVLTAVPLIADVHFNSDVADAAAEIVEAVRINPGNYSKDPSKLEERFIHLLDICREHETAIRIGVNHGSLSPRMMEKYGDTPQGMVESVMEFLRIAVDHDFHDIVISVKASNTRVMVDTVRLLVKTMKKEQMSFPLHLGVTESGEGEDGRIKSAVGIGALLADGIGDTIRVSLSEAPENEIPVAQELVDYFSDDESPRYDGSIRAEVLDNIGGDAEIRYSSFEDNWETFALQAAAECGRLLWDYKATELTLVNPNFSETKLNFLSKDILQAARVRIYKTEYISCPGCGRTMFNLEDTIKKVKAATAHLTGLKIAVMGCIVNGPGEMADADYGYVGAGRDRISLYKGKECVLKNIPQEQAVEKLLALIESDRHSI
ncbi:MAG: (E)-4-hydroxy-3-methylbut-2-enyl-diphosphate synthase [Paludibacteraceae bacterium]|nr:(E)-4-hydroxy-3-methylbut-2-enyl-diphosphate synthase [Paludibacteraceae bacterium]MBR6493563.1 (E)-4-hydroxy-3-methylbut-2-enyl-diphosphate synthase [Paludibacteraceae bacterium]